MAQRLTLLTTREVAQRLKVDVSTVARWVRDGKLSPTFEADGLRGVRLFAPEVVEQFAKARAS